MTEYEQFSTWRNNILNVNPSLHSAERWGRYICVPLDVPRFDHPQLVSWFFEHCKPINKVTADISSEKTGPSEFRSVDVFFDRTFNPIFPQTNLTYIEKNVRDDFIDVFPDVYDELVDSLPLQKIYGIRMWSSTREVAFHREAPHFTDFPGAFRIMMYDQNPKQTLHVVPVLPDRQIRNNAYPVPVLPETNSFAWNNLRSKHGSTYNPAYRKVILIIENYTLDVDRYHDLMKRSVEKYRHHVVVDHHEKNQYVDTTVHP